MRIGLENLPIGREYRQADYSDSHFSKLSAVLQQEMQVITTVSLIGCCLESPLVS